MIWQVFASDADTPNEDLVWSVEAQAGITARLEGTRLFVSVPVGQSGTRLLPVTVRDPQGNMAEASISVLIEQDLRAPEFSLTVQRHPVFSELIEIVVMPDEELVEPPSIRVHGQDLEVVSRSDSTYAASYVHVPGEDLQFVEAVVRGRDRGGNEGMRRQEIGLSWVDQMGGNVQSPDLQLMLNIPNSAAQPGQMAIIYRVHPDEVPAGTEGQSVYSIDLLGGRAWGAPVTLNFISSAKHDETQGVLEWNESEQRWEPLPTRRDDMTGWLAVSIDKPGLYRVGRVSADDVQAVPDLLVYPNPAPYGRRGNHSVRIRPDAAGGRAHPNFQCAGPIRADCCGRVSRGRRMECGLGRDESRGTSGRCRRVLCQIDCRWTALSPSSDRASIGWYAV